MKFPTACYAQSVVYALGSSRGGYERDRHEDVEKILNRYMQSRSSQVTTNLVTA